MIIVNKIYYELIQFGRLYIMIDMYYLSIT